MSNNTIWRMRFTAMLIAGLVLLISGFMTVSFLSCAGGAGFLLYALWLKNKRDKEIRERMEGYE